MAMRIMASRHLRHVDHVHMRNLGELAWPSLPVSFMQIEALTESGSSLADGDETVPDADEQRLLVFESDVTPMATLNPSWRVVCPLGREASGSEKDLALWRSCKLRLSVYCPARLTRAAVLAGDAGAESDAGPRTPPTSASMMHDFGLGAEPVDCVFAAHVDLAALHYLGASLHVIPSAVRHNEVFVEMHKGIYGSRVTLEAMRAAGAHAMEWHSSSRESSNVTYDAHELGELMRAYGELELVTRETAGLADSVAETLRRSSRVREHATVRQQHERQLASLQAERAARCEHGRPDLASTLTKEVDALRRRALELNAAQFSLIGAKRDMLNSLESLEAQHGTLDALQRAKFDRQRDLVEQVYRTFPITADQRNSKKIYRILALHLPNVRFGSAPLTEEGAAAIGLVCRVVLLISTYLEVPLRYHMVPFGSRSCIYDIQDGGELREFPLYVLGNNKDRCEYGIWLLNKNIETLCTLYRVELMDLSKTLFNLRLFLETMIRGDCVPPGTIRVVES